MKNKKVLYKKVIPFSVIIYLFLILIYGCGNKSNSDIVQGENEVWIKDHSFIPDTLNIPVGSTVTWVNQDSAAHTVTSSDTLNSDVKFDSGSIQSQDTYNFTFNSSGVYHYYCKNYPGKMYGVIIVQ